MTHLWLFEYETWAAMLGSRIDSLITSQEQARAQRYVYPAGRRSYRLTRAMLRWLLSRYLRRDPRSLNFKTSAYGKPCLADEALHFNLSHSDDVLAIGVANEELGVDIEAGYSGLKPDELARSILSPKDFDAYAGLSAARRRAFVLRRWTEQEAFSKAIGMGLALKPGSCQWHRLDAHTMCVSRRGVDEAPWHSRYLGRFRNCHLSICSRCSDSLQVFAPTSRAHIFPTQA